MKKFLMLVCGVVFAVLLAGCGSSSSPEDVAKEFAQNVLDKKTEKILDAVYDPKGELKDKGMKELIAGKLAVGFENVEKKIEENGGLKKIETAVVSGDPKKDKQVRVKIIYVCKNGNYEDGVTLVNDDGKWKLKL